MSRSAQIAIFISVLAVLTRLVSIDQPYIDNWSWRQSDVAAIARNFYSKGFHFVHPQIDWAGDRPGYVGTEFPILPFVAALCSKLFGVREWVGRIQAVILFAVSLPVFFLLVRQTFGAVSAIWALVFYSFAPLSVFTSREFMPDIPSLSLAIIGLYLFWRWLDNERKSCFFASAVLISLAILVKLPSAVIGAPLACLAFQRFRCSAFQNFRLWIFVVIALLPAAIWYWHAYEISLKFYPHHFFGAGGVRIMNGRWYWKIGREFARSSLTLPLFILAATGVVVGSSSMRGRFFYCWLAAMLVFTVVVGYGNRHQWYQLPLVPIAAAFAGSSCSVIGQAISSRELKITLSVLLILGFGIFALVQVKPLYRSRSSAALREVGLAIKANTPPGSLIVAADNGDPTVFYYAERTGWHLLERDGIYEGEPVVSEQAIVDVERLRARGATHLVFTWATAWWLDYYQEFAQYIDANAMLVQATRDFSIYKLKPLPK